MVAEFPVVSDLGLLTANCPLPLELSSLPTADCPLLTVLIIAFPAPCHKTMMGH